MEIGKNIQQSFNLYAKNFVTLLLACLITGIISAVTLGILAGPLIGGVIILGLKLLRGEEAKFNEVFGHFNQFIPTFPVTIMLWAASLAVWVIASIPFIGWIIQIIAGPILGLLYFLAIGFVIDQKMKPVEALQRSIGCFAADPLILWVYSLVMVILAGIGAILLMVGVFLTMPLGMAGLIIAYQQISMKEVPPFKPDKQIIRIAGIVTAVLFIIGITCLVFGFGRSAVRNTGAGLTGKIFKATKEKVQVNQRSQQIKIGNMSFGAGLPDNFPNDIPIFPNSEIGGFLGGKDGKISGSTTTFTSKASAGEIHDYYATNLEAKGWTIETSELGDMKMVNFQKGQRKGVITINPGDSKCDILIRIVSE
jgi:MFS family permease